MQRAGPTPQVDVDATTKKYLDSSVLREPSPVRLLLHRRRAVLRATLLDALLAEGEPVFRYSAKGVSRVVIDIPNSTVAYVECFHIIQVEEAFFGTNFSFLYRIAYHLGVHNMHRREFWYYIVLFYWKGGLGDIRVAMEGVSQLLGTFSRRAFDRWIADVAHSWTGRRLRSCIFFF